MKIFDTHTHDAFTNFDADRNEMLQEDFAAGVEGKVQIGCDEKTSKEALELAQTDIKMWSTVGIHPCCVSENYHKRKEAFETFEKMLENNPEKIIGIGETGLDQYHCDSPVERKMQTELFSMHVSLAKKHNKFLVVHSRGARQETLNFFAENIPFDGSVKGVIHCFSEDTHFAKTVTQNYNFFLGIGGVATYPKNTEIREAIVNTDIKFLVTETDSPYLSPQSVRGKRNQSKNIKEIIETIARLKNMDKEECAEILWNNAQRLIFGEPKFEERSKK